MQMRKWLISGEINYKLCRICSLSPRVFLDRCCNLVIVSQTKLDVALADEIDFRAVRLSKQMVTDLSVL